MVVLVDDAEREDEGDLMLAAAHATPEAVNLLTREARGLICAPMDHVTADRLDLPPMVPPEQNMARYGTAFTLSVEARAGVTTGISAADRARTLHVLADPASTATDLVRPGHIFPLRAHPRGVLGRPGHTEAAADLCRLAGVAPVGVICEVLAPDGAMARLPELNQLAARLGIGVLAIADLIAFRQQYDGIIERVAMAQLPTAYGAAVVSAYRAVDAIEPHLALVYGDLSTPGPVLVRLHSECLTGDVFGSERCDCGEQLRAATEAIAAAGRGVVIYLRQEGRGIGLVDKLRAYALQEEGLDTVEANIHLGLPVDARAYGSAAAIVRALGVRYVRLLTNNPDKVREWTEAGIVVVERVPLTIPARPTNKGYLATKREKLGHWLPVARGEIDDTAVRGGAHATV
jgi:3,4-dihydroxy 2-butanone 4-phosphate synthase/GTP cyclohydrolase II